MKTLLSEEVLVTEEVFKKSKFITYISKVENDYELQNFIKKYSVKEAKHNCYAYSYGITNIIKGYENDKEPQGTGGEPISKLIDNLEIRNIVILVVRFFGGTKLGVGPLLRAYLSGAKNLLKQQVFHLLSIKYKIYFRYSITNTKIVENNLAKLKFSLVSKQFKDDICELEVLIDDINNLKSLEKYIEIIDNKKDYF